MEGSVVTGTSRLQYLEAIVEQSMAEVFVPSRKKHVDQGSSAVQHSEVSV